MATSLAVPQLTTDFVRALCTIVFMRWTGCVFDCDDSYSKRTRLL